MPKENLGKRFGWLDKQLAGKQYLMGDKFTVADAYLFTALRWASRIDMDLGKWPNLKAYVDRVAARPKAQEALNAEGLSTCPTKLGTAAARENAWRPFTGGPL